jgi:hypothetical protein
MMLIKRRRHSDEKRTGTLASVGVGGDHGCGVAGGGADRKEPMKESRLNLDEKVIALVAKRAVILEYKLDTWVNHVLAKTEGLVGDIQMPKKDRKDRGNDKGRN